MRKIFISYSRHDVEFVTKLHTGLVDGGYSVFYDQELVGGQQWWDTLLEQIEDCSVFMPVLSDDYADSEPCRREAAYAHSLNKPMVPVIQAAGFGSDLLPDAVRETQWVLFAPDAVPWGLIRALNQLHEAPPLPSPMPSRPEVPISYMDQLLDRINSDVELTRLQQLDVIDQLEAKAHGRDLADVERLMRRLRARGELVASVAERIDLFLAGTSSARTVRVGDTSATETVVELEELDECVIGQGTVYLLREAGGDPDVPLIEVLDAETGTRLGSLFSQQIPSDEFDESDDFRLLGFDRDSGTVILSTWMSVLLVGPRLTTVRRVGLGSSVPGVDDECRQPVELYLAPGRALLAWQSDVYPLGPTDSALLEIYLEPSNEPTSESIRLVAQAPYVSGGWLDIGRTLYAFFEYDAELGEVSDRRVRVVDLRAEGRSFQIELPRPHVWGRSHLLWHDGYLFWYSNEGPAFAPASRSASGMTPIWSQLETIPWTAETVGHAWLPTPGGMFLVQLGDEAPVGQQRFDRGRLTVTPPEEAIAVSYDGRLTWSRLGNHLQARDSDGGLCFSSDQYRMPFGWNHPSAEDSSVWVADHAEWFQRVSDPWYEADEEPDDEPDYDGRPVIKALDRASKAVYAIRKVEDRYDLIRAPLIISEPSGDSARSEANAPAQAAREQSPRPRASEVVAEISFDLPSASGWVKSGWGRLYVPRGARDPGTDDDSKVAGISVYDLASGAELSRHDFTEAVALWQLNVHLVPTEPTRDWRLCASFDDEMLHFDPVHAVLFGSTPGEGMAVVQPHLIAENAASMRDDSWEWQDEGSFAFAHGTAAVGLCTYNGGSRVACIELDKDGSPTRCVDHLLNLRWDYPSFQILGPKRVLIRPGVGDYEDDQPMPLIILEADGTHRQVSVSTAYGDPFIGKAPLLVNNMLFWTSTRFLEFARFDAEQGRTVGPVTTFEYDNDVDGSGWSLENDGSVRAIRSDGAEERWADGALQDISDAASGHGAAGHDSSDESDAQFTWTFNADKTAFRILRHPGT